MARISFWYVSELCWLFSMAHLCSFFFFSFIFNFASYPMELLTSLVGLCTKHAHQNSRHIDSTPKMVTLEILVRASVRGKERGSSTCTGEYISAMNRQIFVHPAVRQLMYGHWDLWKEYVTRCLLRRRPLPLLTQFCFIPWALTPRTANNPPRFQLDQWVTPTQSNPFRDHIKDYCVGAVCSWPETNPNRSCISDQGSTYKSEIGQQIQQKTKQL